VDDKPKMTCSEKIMWVAAVALTMLVEAALIAFAYETGIMDTIKGLLRS
jgi:hypothetical protein